MKSCQRCGFSNESEAVVCCACGCPLIAGPIPGRPPPLVAARPTPLRPAVIMIALLVTAALFLAVGYSRKRSDLTRERDRLTADRAVLEKEHADRVQEQIEQE